MSGTAPLAPDPVGGGKTEPDADYVLEHAPVGLITAEVDGTILHANKILRRWLGMEQEGLRGRRFGRLLTVGGRIYYETHMAPMLGVVGRVDEVALDLIGQDGRTVQALVSAVREQPAPDRPERLIITVFHAPTRRSYERETLEARKRAEADLEQAARANDELVRLANTDALTGLVNRRCFLERLAQQLDRRAQGPARRAALLMCDLDHFKAVNDTFGHSGGDDVLRAFGELVASSLRGTDTAGRLGGEEFAILLVGADLVGATGFAERLRARVRAMRVVSDGRPIDVTVSIGVTAVEQEDRETADVMTRADKALYAAKSGGRDRVETAAGELTG